MFSPRKYKLLLLTILFPIVLLSQNQYNFKQFGNEAGDYFSSPFHWSENDILTFGIITATTLGIIQFDETIKDGFQKINSDNDFWLMEAGRYWGEAIPTL